MSSKNSEKLSQTAQYLLDECRMVLPGIQALFGFQLIAVFNARFAEVLSSGEQRLHLLSIMLVVMCIVMIMSPAAYHRQSRHQEVTQRFITVTTRLLLWTMWPLAAGLSMDIYLIGRVIVDAMMGCILAVGVVCWAFAFWFLLPRLDRPNV